MHQRLGDRITPFCLTLFLARIPKTMLTTKKRSVPSPMQLELARVLLVDNNPAARLTLQTVLKAGGYRVDSAASAAEAVNKMEQQEYELVLSDITMESPEAGFRVLAFARTMEYQPATAVVTAQVFSAIASDSLKKVLVEPQGIPDLLGKVADLISRRASRRMARHLRQAPAAGC